MAKTWCVHYNGTVNECCRAGHKYVDVAGQQTTEEYAEAVGRAEPYGWDVRTIGLWKRVPCFADRADQGSCPDQRFPTPEEQAEEDARIDKAIEQIGQARNAIVEHLKFEYRIGTNASGVVECPICGGRLHFGYAGAYNGHIHGHCETDGCVNWME